MKKLFYINGTAANRISFYLLALFVVLLPFDYFYSQLVLGCWALHTLIHCKKSSLQRLRETKTWLPVLLYLMLLASVTYSIDKREGIDISGRQSSPAAAAGIVCPQQF